MSITSRVPVVRVLRRLWVVVVCVVVAGIVAALLSQGASSYSADATLIVPDGAKPADPGRATEAQRLAASYAAVLGRDDVLLPALATAVGRSRSSAEDRLTIANITNSSVVQVTYRGGSRSEALLGVQTVLRNITGATPATSTVGPGTLQTVRVSTTADKDGGVPALPVGLVLGLALGLVLAVALDRSDARVDDSSDLADLVPAPTSVLQTSSAAVLALSGRWSRQLEPGDSVALVPVLPGDRGSATTLYGQLDDLGRAAGRTSSSVATLPTHDGRVVPLTLEPGTLAGEVSGEVLSTSASALVLVVSKGSSLRKVHTALQALDGLDGRLLWCVITPHESRRASHTRSQPPVSAPAPAVSPAALPTVSAGAGQPVSSEAGRD